ncbi:MAG: Na+:solute symporter [Phycisphaerales bacterium]|nr:Na+:solute symporter [Phycisphaerales bacterium]
MAEATGSALAPLDWVVIGCYLVLVIGIAIWFARRGSRSAGGYFLAGRSLPWWIAGTSIVATTFSSDTPIQVVKLVREGGIGENWWWWAMAAGHSAGIFLFAPLWRRSGLLTDVEFITTRYEGTAARVLRIVDGLWQGLLVNGVVLASVTIAMAVIAGTLLGIPPEAEVTMLGVTVSTTLLITIVLAVLTVGYSLISGLYGVAWSDLPQFLVAMVGSSILAAVVVSELGGPTEMLARIDAQPWTTGNASAIAPSVEGPLAILTVVTWFSVNWWSRAQGHGALAQRLLATRSPRDGALAMAWFTCAHYVLRPWPWILVALASLAVVPQVMDANGVWVSSIDDQAVFPWMIREYLGPGLRGLLAVSMLAAFMSTIDTHINLSSAYLLNDVVRPLGRLMTGRPDPPGGAEAERGPRDVLYGRLLTLPVLILVIVVAAGLTDIITLYKYLGVIMAGAAPIMILRWYWWRLTAWSEIAAMVAAFVVGNGLAMYGPLVPPEHGPDINFGARILLVTAISAVAWGLATALSRPVSKEHLETFYQRVRPSGPGWGPIVRTLGVTPSRVLPLVGWAILATTATWGGIVGVGWLVLGKPALGTALLVISAAIAVPVARRAARVDPV